MGIAAALVGFGLLLFKERWQKLLILLVMMVALLGYARLVDRPDTSWRYKVWKSAITKTMPQAPWFGSGLGHWKLHYSKKVIAKNTLNQFFMQAHNEFIQARYEMGFFAGVIILGFISTTFYRGAKRLISGYDHYLAMGLMSLVVIIVTSCVFFTFHIPVIAGAMLTIMAVVQARLKC